MHKKVAVLAVLLGGIPAAPAHAVFPFAQETEADAKAEFEAKSAAVDENDATALFELALWAESKGLTTDSKRVLRKVIKVDKDHAEARKLLGYVMYEGKWVTEREKERLEKKAEEEEKLAQGLRKWKGEWYPAEYVENFERGLVLVEIDGEQKWVSEKDKERIEKGLVLHKGHWVTPEDKEKIDQGYFLVGEKWVPLEEANAAHSSMDDPWLLDGECVSLFSTCNHDFAQTALTHADRAVREAYQILGVPLPEEFPKITLMLLTNIEDYKAVGARANDNFDAEMSSNYGCFSMQDPNIEQYLGVVLYDVLDENNAQANDNYTRYLVRHAATEAAVRNMRWQEEVPRWFVTGMATYCSRYWDPFYPDGIRALAQWSASNLGAKGGLMKLDSFFEPFTVSHQTILESGLLISFLLHADNVPADVKQEWEALKGVIQSEDQKGLSKAFLKFETAMTKKGEDPVLAYMDALFAG